jgi:hypothetical protein
MKKIRRPETTFRVLAGPFLGTKLRFSPKYTDARTFETPQPRKNRNEIAALNGQWFWRFQRQAQNAHTSARLTSPS